MAALRVRVGAGHRGIRLREGLGPAGRLWALVGQPPKLSLCQAWQARLIVYRVQAKAAPILTGVLNSARV